ncbi:hypothetical protein MTYP_01065 [Methylophilaceae bacterium]|nr:hypothetical protein MTYP_01065 [Methylophilaceae bacterium]
MIQIPDHRIDCPFHVCSCEPSQGFGHCCFLFVLPGQCVDGFQFPFEFFYLSQQRVWRAGLRDEVDQLFDLTLDVDPLRLQFLQVIGGGFICGQAFVVLQRGIDHLVAGQILQDLFDHELVYLAGGDAWTFFQAVVAITICVPAFAAGRFQQSGQHVGMFGLPAPAGGFGFERIEYLVCFRLGDQRFVGVFLDQPLFARTILALCPALFRMPVPDRVAGIGERVALDVQQRGDWPIESEIRLGLGT